jgi:ABC-type lipoprotein export system ATPase subunit
MHHTPIEGGRDPSRSGSGKIAILEMIRLIDEKVNRGEVTGEQVRCCSE